MKYKPVKISDLIDTIVMRENFEKSNKRFCLSAKRALDLCYVCPEYKTCESRREKK